MTKLLLFTLLFLSERGYWLTTQPDLPEMQIKGVVTDLYGVPLTGVRIEMLKEDSEIVLTSSMSNPDGEYTLSMSKVLMKSCHLRFSRKGFITEVIGRLMVRPYSKVEIDVGLASSDFWGSLSRETIFLVVDDKKRPLNGVSVSVFCPYNSIANERGVTYSDSKKAGAWTWKSNYAGRFIVYAKKAGYDIATQVITLTPDTPQSHTIVLTLAPLR